MTKLNLIGREGWLHTGAESQHKIPDFVAVPCPKIGMALSHGPICLDCEFFTGLHEVAKHKDWARRYRIVCAAPTPRSIEWPMPEIPCVRCPKIAFQLTPVRSACEAGCNLFGGRILVEKRGRTVDCVKCSHPIARSVESIVMPKPYNSLEVDGG